MLLMPNLHLRQHCFRRFHMLPAKTPPPGDHRVPLPGIRARLNRGARTQKAPDGAGALAKPAEKPDQFFR
jgi:hypothetical protein